MICPTKEIANLLLYSLMGFMLDKAITIRSLEIFNNFVIKY